MRTPPRRINQELARRAEVLASASALVEADGWDRAARRGRALIG